MKEYTGPPMQCIGKDLQIKLRIFMYLVQLRFSKKAKKIDEITQLFWRLLGKFQIT